MIPAPQGAVSVHADQALQEIAATRCDPADMTANAVIYGAFYGDPWARMNAPESAYAALTRYLRDLPPKEAADAGWAAATDPVHVAGHRAAFPDAWDGAADFIRSLSDVRGPSAPTPPAAETGDE